MWSERSVPRYVALTDRDVIDAVIEIFDGVEYSEEDYRNRKVLFDRKEAAPSPEAVRPPKPGPKEPLF